jgi:ferric-dicitrate binding protein FerR (iron transport regulator)
MNIKMTKELLKKFLNDSCTDDELKEVVSWVGTDAFSDESKNWGIQNWESNRVDENLGDSDKFGSLLDKIHHKINIENHKQIIQKSKPSTIRLFATWITRAAAILLLPVLGLHFYTVSESASGSDKYASLAVDSLEIIAPIGSRTVVQLTDGSEVHLNYGSKLKYPQIFSGNTREVVLTGEGYFNVAHNPDKPFIVKTGKLDIKALGTAFNVFAYTDVDVIKATLVEGKVVLEHPGKNCKEKTIGGMVPGQHVAYNTSTGEIFSSEGNIEKYIAWKDGKLVFENESICQVAARLSRMFNVDIEIDDNIKDLTYTVTFVNEPLFQILDLFTMATPVNYRVLPRNKLPDGTFSKQKIILEKRN